MNIALKQIRINISEIYYLIGQELRMRNMSYTNQNTINATSSNENSKSDAQISFDEEYTLNTTSEKQMQAHTMKIQPEMKKCIIHHNSSTIHTYHK